MGDEVKIHLGLIGAGARGCAIMRTIAGISGIALTRVASCNPATAGLVPAGCVVTDDWRAMLGPSAMHGVIIATPPSQHFAMVREAISSGIPVLVEKPLALNVGEAMALRQIASMSQGMVMVNHTPLVHPAFRVIKELVAVVGPVRAIRVAAGDQGPAHLDTSVLWEWGPHALAMCLDLLDGTPEDVSAIVQVRRDIPVGVGETIDLRFEFPGEVDVRINLSNLLPTARQYFAVHCDKVVLVFDQTAPHVLTLHPPTDHFADPMDAGQVIDVPTEDSLSNAIMTFAMAIAGNVDDQGGLELGADVVVALARCQSFLDEKASRVS